MKQKVTILLLLLFTCISVLAASQQDVLNPDNRPKGQLNPAPFATYPQTRVQNLISSTVIWEENFESLPTTWTLGSGWNMGADPVWGAHSNPYSAYTNHLYGANANYLLLSPVINLPALANPGDELKLSFWNTWEAESGYDFVYLDIIQNGVLVNTLSTQTGTSGWQEMNFVLNEYAGEAVQLQFRLTSDYDYNYNGWGLDDLLIKHNVYETIPELNLLSLNVQNFPFIYSTLSVVMEGFDMSTLDASNFQVYENDVLQTNYFEVVPPSTGTGSRLVDIAFLMDNSGSMGSSITAVSNNVTNFINNLAASGGDSALGLCRYGHSGGNPYLEDQGILTTDLPYFRDSVWPRNYASGSYEPGYYAITQSLAGFNWRPGSQKVVIIITDETPNQGGAYLDDAITACTNSGAILFALTLSSLYSTFTPITSVTGGAVFDINSSFDAILTQISNIIVSNYILSYRSSSPTHDGVLRNLRYVMNYQNYSAETTGSYFPGQAPTIVRTPATIAMDTVAQLDNMEIVIQAIITDSYAPFTNLARLYYETLTTRNFAYVDMTNLGGDLWQGIIPASAVLTPGVGYYLSASDGQSTTTLPSVEPSNNPFTIAVLPNVPPQIAHTPATQVPYNAPLVVAANVTDETQFVAAVELFYRRYGQLTYTNAPMQNVAGSVYSATIPAGVVANSGVEYYIRAADNYGMTAAAGFPDNPIYVPALLDGIIIPGGIITDYTWDLDDSPFYINGNISVEPGNTLIIEPGSELIFAPETGLTVLGGLLATGVTFTASDPQLGWLGIFIESNSPQIQLNNCQILHARRAVVLQNAHASLSNCNINKDGTFNDELGISATGNCNAVFNNLNVFNYSRGIVFHNEDLRVTSSPSLTNVRIRNTSSSIRPDSRGLEVIGAVGLAISDAEIAEYDDGIYWDAQGTSDYRTTPSLTNVRIRNTSSSIRNAGIGLKLIDMSSVIMDADSIGGYPIGLDVQNNGVNRTTTSASLSNVRIRNTSSSIRTDSFGAKLSGNIAATINNLEIDDYNSGIFFIADSTFTRTSASASLTNVRIRNTSSSIRTDSYGIKLMGGIYANLNDLEIDDYDYGLHYQGNGLPFDRTTPSLTNVRIRNTSSSIRTAGYGIKLMDLAAVNVENDSIVGYPTGLEIVNNDITRTTTSASLSNVRIRNTSSSIRTDSFGARLTGNIAATVNDLELTDYATGFKMDNTTQTRTAASASLTNVRIRNTSSSIRTETFGASLTGNILATFDSLDIVDYSTGIYYEGNGQPFDRTTPSLSNVRIRNTSSSIREPVKGFVLKNLAGIELNKNIVYPNVENSHGNTTGYGISLDAVNNATIAQNTVWGLSSGLAILNSANTNFNHNVIWTNGPALDSPIIDPAGSATVNTCDISWIGGVVAGPENLNINPLFYKPLDGNFYLKLRSPLRDTGIGALPFDFDAIADVMSYDMTPGWNMMGVPYTTQTGQNTPLAIFADDLNPFWIAPNYTSIVQMNTNSILMNPVTNYPYWGLLNFEYTGNYNIPTQVRCGVGYWVRNPYTTATPVDIYGLMDDGPYTLNVPGANSSTNGWYLLANPYDQPLSFMDGSITTVGMLPASARVYNRSSNSYDFVDNDPSNDNQAGNAAAIPPWSAFFIKAYGGTDQMFFSYPESDARQEAVNDPIAGNSFSPGSSAKPLWQLTLNAVCEGGSDALNFGISPSASDGYDPMDVPELPNAPFVLNRGLEFTIANNDWEQSPGNYTRDIRNAETGVWSWPLLLNVENLLVDGRFTGAIRIMPESGSKLPATYRYTLINPATGQSCDLQCESLLLNLDIDTATYDGVTLPWLIPLRVEVSPLNAGVLQDNRDIIFATNYPNPFNPETTISYSLGMDSAVSLEIYNIKGQLVQRLVNEPQVQGTHSVVWNGKDTNNREVSSGFYFYRLNAGTSSLTRKILLMK